MHTYPLDLFPYFPFGKFFPLIRIFESRIQILRYNQKVHMFTCCVTVNDNNIMKHEFNLNNTVYRCIF